MPSGRGGRKNVQELPVWCYTGDVRNASAHLYIDSAAVVPAGLIGDGGQRPGQGSNPDHGGIRWRPIFAGVEIKVWTLYRGSVIPKN